MLMVIDECPQVDWQPSLDGSTSPAMLSHAKSTINNTKVVTRQIHGSKGR
jgi:hypothetical protein